MNAWIILAIAIVFEIAGTSLLKASDGFARWGLGAASIACYWVCFAFLAIAIKSIPVGVAYAIWAGVGIAVVALIGWLFFSQSLNVAQIGFILLILIGAVGLNLTTPHERGATASSQQNSA
jgi:multidrug transporter EmrE-like cation transporter